MAQVIPLFGAKPEISPVISAIAPEPAQAPVSAKQTAETEQVSLHDGDLVVYRRPGASSKWQYRLRLPSGEYERKTTGKRTLDEAKKVAEARYQEVIEAASIVLTMRRSGTAGAGRWRGSASASWRGWACG